MQTQLYLERETGAKLIVLYEEMLWVYNLDEKSKWDLGRANVPGITPDVALASNIVGRRHGEIYQAGDFWFYEDKGSVNGTFYNGTKIPRDSNGYAHPVQLTEGDILQIDSEDKTHTNAIWMLFTQNFHQEGWKKMNIGEGDVVTIGREPGCNILIEEGYVSGIHAQIFCNGGVYYIKDCGSMSGTWVNGRAVKGVQALERKSHIAICDYHFVFFDGSLLYCSNIVKNYETVIPAYGDGGYDAGGYSDGGYSAGGYDAGGYGYDDMGGYASGYGDDRYPVTETRGVRNQKVFRVTINSKTVKDSMGKGDKMLLKDVSLDIEEGALVAIIGSSGAGKSTLMSCINGIDKSGVDGRVLLYGEDFYSNYERLKYLIGFVPQKDDEVLDQMLKVKDELAASAKLKLPAGTKKAEIKRRVKKTLEELHLEAKGDTLICNLSGGERKRVNIGVELVADKKIMCLDEPDAGLDPLMKQELFKLLLRIAHEQNKTIMVVIHDVTELQLFDQIIMMTKLDGVGRVAYNGKPSDIYTYFGADTMTEVYSLMVEYPERYVR